MNSLILVPILLLMGVVIVGLVAIQYIDWEEEKAEDQYRQVVAENLRQAQLRYEAEIADKEWRAQGHYNSGVQTCRELTIGSPDALTRCIERVEREAWNIRYG